ncbi:MAG: hypothetical protein QOD34_4046 [Mycobacterium sp.]|nr:hypothetical protein [Mycobacterium sp.]
MPARGPVDPAFVGPVTEGPGVPTWACSRHSSHRSSRRSALVFSPGFRQGVYVADEGI